MAFTRYRNAGHRSVTIARRYAGPESSGNASTSCWAVQWGGVLGHVEVDHTPAVVGEHDEDEENAEASGGQR